MGSGGGGGIVKHIAGGPVFSQASGLKKLYMDPFERGAQSAQDAAMAQQNEAKRQRAELKQMTEEVTVRGLADYDKALAAQERNMARQEQLLSQIDPTVIQASQEALRLLRGESSSALAPLKNQRAQQRQKLLNTLRAQLGPGAETSTAGIQALTRFDAETDNLFAGAQQQALANVGNVFSQFNSGRPDMLRESAGFGQMATGRAGLRYTQAGLMSGANQNVLNAAGAGAVGNLLMQQKNQQINNSLLQLGSTVVGSYFGGPMGGQMGSQFGSAVGGSPQTASANPYGK